MCVCACEVWVCAETIVGLFFTDNKQCNEVNGGGQKQSFNNVYGTRSFSVILVMSSLVILGYLIFQISRGLH